MEFEVLFSLEKRKQNSNKNQIYCSFITSSTNFAFRNIFCIIYLKGL